MPDAGWWLDGERQRGGRFDQHQGSHDPRRPVGMRRFVRPPDRLWNERKEGVVDDLDEPNEPDHGEGRDGLDNQNRLREMPRRECIRHSCGVGTNWRKTPQEATAD